MTQFLNLFPSPVTMSHIGLHEKVYESLYEDWKYDFQEGNLKNDVLKELKTRIDEKVNEYWKFCGYNEAELFAMCAQYNEFVTGEYLVPHHHAGSLVSWCYYVSVPEGAGAIGFIDPRGNTSWDFYRKKAPVQDFMPHSGDLFIFPGWLIHMVHPNLSPEKRTTISGDHHFKEVVDLWQPMFNGRDKTNANNFY